MTPSAATFSPRRAGAGAAVVVALALLSPCSTRRCCLAGPPSSPIPIPSPKRRNRPSGNGGRPSLSPSSGARTVLTFRRPTSSDAGERIFRSADGGDLRFNHDSVGLTNPCLHVAVPASAASAEPPGRRCRSKNDDDDTDPAEGRWFPPPAAVVEGDADAGGEGGGEWRVLRYRRRVGSGERCYAAVRDAALEWEFHAGDEEGGGGGGGASVGIVKVPPPRSSSSSSSSPSREGQFLWRRRRRAGYDVYDNVPRWNDCGGVAEPLTGETARNVLQIWPGWGWEGGSGSPSSSSSPRPGRRLVTYSETTLGVGVGVGGGRGVRWRLPSLYAANPVAVVYDLVDQAGPDGGLYTSTAYATLRGHLLSGEERVTVALRDGGGGTGGGNVPRGNAAASATEFFRDANAGYVDVEILSYSRAAPSAWGRLAWPLIGRMQDQFFRRQMDALERVARENGADEEGRAHPPWLFKYSNAQ